MAASMSRLSFKTLQYVSRTSARRKSPPSTCPNRAFNSTPLHRRREDPANDSAPRKPQRQPFKFSLSDLDADERSSYNSLPPDERQQWREEAQEMHDYMTRPEVESALHGEVSRAVRETAQESPPQQSTQRRIKPGFFAMGELEAQDTGEDEEFDNDDITSLAHGELEQHREMRHYARIAAWEMPLLSSTPLPTPLPTPDPS